jgi:hypothetical protein
LEIQLLTDESSATERERIWKYLESRGNASYFLSWSWVENWLANLAAEARPKLAVGWEGGQPRLAFFVGEKDLYGRDWLFGVGRRGTRQEKVRESLFTGRHLFARRAWFINATGEPRLDRLHVEYNGFIGIRPEGLDLGELIRALPAGWEELYWQGCAESLLTCFTRSSLRPYRLIIDRREAAPFVDLALVRKKGGDYLSLLSANTRSQIRRAYRLAGRDNLHFEVAATRSEALDIYEELLFWHDKVWQDRGGEGAFANPFFRRFHESLVKKRFEAGEIQLCRLRRGRTTVACLYNFVYGDRVFFYQSGINYTLDPAGKPGYLAQVEAIRHNLEAGRQVYDFLAGGERYKESLATGKNYLLWLRVQKPLVKFTIEGWFKKTVRRLRG